MENRDSLNKSSISAAQRRMIVMHEKTPESSAYTETLLSYVQYPVDADDIFKRLLESHPILKTIIENTENGEYRTKFYEFEPRINKEIIGTGEDVKEFIKETTPVIPVLSSPLYRFRHVTAGHRHHIILHVHHIICDDVTLMSLNRTLHNLLNGAEFKTTKDQNQLLVQTEAEYIKSNKFEVDEVYWRDIYSTLPLTSEMISNISSSWNDTTTYRANQKMTILLRESQAMVQTICHSLQITAFQYHLSLTAMVLQQYLGTSDICLQVPISNRSFQFQHTVGLFVNTVVPRIKTNYLMTLKENIKNISEVFLKVMEHSNYPMNCLASSILKTHRQSLSTLCIAMFNFATTSSHAQIRIPSKHAKMPISIDIIQDKVSGETELIMEWAEDLVPSGMAERLFESLFEVLSSTDLTIDRRLQETSFLSKAEVKLLQALSKHQEILHVKNVPCQSTLEAHTKEHGDKVAVVCDDGKLTYDQLNRMANVVAHHILSIVEPSILKKQPVVLVMEKDEKAIAAILGIWKAGGFFLPVSLSNTAAMNDIFERSSPALVLTSVTEDFILGDSFPVINVNEIAHDTSNYISVTASIDDLAYVIRTSGSTGTPKQCKIRHRSLQVMASSWKKAYKMTECEVTILQWAPLSFDVFVGDVVRALISVAGTLVVCPDEKRLDVGYILNTIQSHQVSIMEVTPQFGQQLVENAEDGNLNSLKTLILGSDTVQTHLYKKIKSHLRADQRLLNSYGMTEATIDSSFFEGSPPDTASGTVPIGKPLPGVIYHIVNKDTLQLCPVGTVGELYIGGDVLAEGDVDLVRLPLTDSMSLKTGDVARWLPSGDVELLGRLDNMLKLRGFRISTTEIENKIASIDSKIKSVCVLPLSNDAEVELLCTFITVYDEDDGFINKVGVSQKLKGTLPYYMIPDIVHVIDKIPLTTNGKVDRRALPKIEDLLKEGKSKSNDAQPDVSSTVSILSALFAKAMGLDAGAIDNELTFMEQGGHSLILLRFASSIKMSTEYDIGICNIFSYPSIAALANYIDKKSELEATTT
ncbi:hypothetical protein LOTGIDRAFT_174606 [Lottia gigantea]|uniref:Carrier domain-containing protein n=1 Tax=Lottia gigantea TaxID=225164 RepID=V4C667_LOTGI|nr:hypothetical protein LOTGIDRAFT_174606 [Lottia gigantea]ESO97124.1 hypothetical protein LOTGIDRAFT_174606 [Lottia gigantea]